MGWYVDELAELGRLREIRFLTAASDNGQDLSDVLEVLDRRIEFVRAKSEMALVEVNTMAREALKEMNRT